MKTVQEQIEKLFSMDTIPVYVEHIDIEIDADETLYSAEKYINDEIRILRFIIRDDKVMVYKAI